MYLNTKSVRSGTDLTDGVFKCEIRVSFGVTFDPLASPHSRGGSKGHPKMVQKKVFFRVFLSFEIIRAQKGVLFSNLQKPESFFSTKGGHFWTPFGGGLDPNLTDLDPDLIKLVSQTIICVSQTIICV